MPRWALVVLLGLVAQTSPSQEALDPTNATRETNGVLWWDVRDLRVEGQGWAETKAPYDRLPSKAEGVVREPVWDLSRHSAGICARFITDAQVIRARWTLTSDRLAMAHMPASSVSGLDLYVRSEGGPWKWLAVGAPEKAPVNEVVLAQGLLPGKREYLLYLPLYNGVQSVSVGLPEGSVVERPAPNPKKPIVFYGTSITHGASASRCGMTHPAILGRRFDQPVINLGFSGNGRMDPEVVDLLAELDPAVYVIDCLPNMDANDVAKRTEPLVQKLRAAHPQAPILLVEDRSYSDAFLVPSKKKRNETSRKALREAFDKMTSAGVQHLYYLEGENLLGEDNEGTVDSSHPTDLGFWRQAAAFQKPLEKILMDK